MATDETTQTNSVVDKRGLAGKISYWLAWLAALAAAAALVALFTNASDCTNCSGIFCWWKLAAVAVTFAAVSIALSNNDPPAPPQTGNNKNGPPAPPATGGDNKDGP